MSVAGGTVRAGSSDPAAWARLLPARRTTYRVVRGRLVTVRLNPAFQTVDPQFGARLIAGLRSLGNTAADLPVRVHPVASPRRRVTAGGENDPSIPPSTS